MLTNVDRFWKIYTIDGALKRVHRWLDSYNTESCRRTFEGRGYIIDGVQPGKVIGI